MNRYILIYIDLYRYILIYIDIDLYIIGLYIGLYIGIVGAKSPDGKGEIARWKGQFRPTFFFLFTKSSQLKRSFWAFLHISDLKI